MECVLVIFFLDIFSLILLILIFLMLCCIICFIFEYWLVKIIWSGIVFFGLGKVIDLMRYIFLGLFVNLVIFVIRFFFGLVIFFVFVRY